ncbi:hypothetical protein E4U50_004242 [Claviceps purpurea]|nr:hypothetical protein E4U50_004242 [Claviceps purpurea]
MVSGPLVWLSGLAVLVARAAAAAAGDDVVTSDTFFYGQSPAVYPSPEMTGGSEWATAHGKAKALVAKISLLERVSLTGGAFSKTGCSGIIAPIPRLNFSGMCLSDSRNGLCTDLVNTYPAGLHVGARYLEQGLDAQARRSHGRRNQEKRRQRLSGTAGLVVRPAGRIVRGGRSWEGFSTDPYLSGCLAARTIEGVQSEGVQHCRVHFIANEQELNRRPVLGAEAVSPNLDDRTMHEIYLMATAHVLVKNTKGALPLRSPRSISVFGYSARSADVLAPSADEVSLNMWRYGQTSISVGQAVEGLLGNAQPAATKGTLMGGGGSGGSTPAVFVSPYDALSVRAAQDDMALYHDFSSPTPESRHGVYLDYKYFDKYNVTPRYEFGFGLSYTTFELSHLKIQTQSQSTGGSGSGSGSGNTGEWPYCPWRPGRFVRHHRPGERQGAQHGRDGCWQAQKFRSCMSGFQRARRSSSVGLRSPFCDRERLRWLSLSSRGGI